MDLSHNQRKTLTSLGWIVIFGIAVYLIPLVIQNFKITDFWISLFASGLIILLAANLYRGTVLDKNIRFDFSWIYWLLVYTAAFWLMNNFLPASIKSDNVIFWYLLFGVGLRLIAIFARKIQPGGYHSGIHLPGFPWWVYLVVIFLIASFVKIPYATHLANDPFLVCKEDNKVYLKDQYNNLFGDLGRMTSQMSLSILCLEYQSSECHPTCSSGRPACECHANIWDVVMHPAFGYNRIGR